MRKQFGPKPFLYPMPVLILAAYGPDGTPNAMNAAWGGISEENQISVCVDPSRKTLECIRHSGAFTVSIGTADQMTACDYVGIVSGNDVPDKFARSGFHATASGTVNAPLIEELPMALECRFLRFEEEDSRLVGEIVNVCAEESILNERGLVDPAKLRPIAYDPMNHTYLALGEAVGLAYREGQKLMK